METLKGRTALVTGASRGLGAAIALELAARGAQVAVNYFAKRDRAEQLCDSIKQQGGEADCLLCRCAPGSGYRENGPGNQ